MKKVKNIVSVILAYAATYSMFFIDADLTQPGTLIDFVITGIIVSVGFKMLWVFATADDDADEVKT